MSFLASFEALLYRYTLQENIVIGCPIAVRPQSNIQQLIGCFLNTLPFRTDVNGNPGFLELIQRVRQRCLAAYGHQDAPYEQMVAGIQRERALDQASLFQVMFTLERFARSGTKQDHTEQRAGTLKHDSGAGGP